ncbi:MAG: putative DNA binding domain-containing protein [Candidatus Margulisbacteria bacterium]|nr:putative DNA binding domain-containing protein [Candidatus Margulisiibacteriota bacterium]MBU1022535.1 putative DNA binding domain-containing protein [Candidatus Margulisiibacteriota bacterium]MBU1728821.1 putative DNA binding domain-containing protein [Candidatus Margulisiibacteriota bacterium]MBU1955787.1 putative DNA binding domain-containing protein [Candidatus Margulisiibacteriota bacterium]
MVILLIMTWDEIVALLGQGEGQSVEFEKIIPSEDDIARELVAFSNSDGGKIIYGLDDKNKHLIGVDVPSNFKDKIEYIGKTRCVPKIIAEVEIQDKSGKKVVIVTVAEGDEKPYKTDDIVYIRDGKQSRPAKENETKEITCAWSGKGLNKRQIRTLQLISEHNAMTNREYREAFGVSHKTAHLELTMLVDKKLLLTQGSGRSTCYILPMPVEEELEEEVYAEEG